MAVTALYCTMDDVKNILSAAGVTARLDDVPPDDDGDVLDEAASIIDEYCYTRYGANLTRSRVVKHWAAALAAVALCERRGNPPPIGLVRKCDRVMESLKRVLSNGRQIPDIAQVKAGAPVMSNMHVQLYPYPHSVVESSGKRSTGKPENYQQNRDVLGRWIYDYTI